MDKLSSKVLVVEDAGPVAELLTYLLEGAGYEVEVAATVAAARAAIAGQLPATLVILDAGLPDGDGIDLLDAIRAQPAWSGAAVLMLSAASDEGAIVRALSAGANEYLIKPFQPWELLERVRRMMDAQAAQVRTAR